MTEIRLFEPKGIRLVGPLPVAVLHHLATPAAKAAFTAGGVE